MFVKTDVQNLLIACSYFSVYFHVYSKPNQKKKTPKIP